MVQAMFDPASPLFGGIEAGGTKTICMIGRSPSDIGAEARIETTTPGTTIAEVIAFFEAHKQDLGPLSALGIASFGPIDLDAASLTYGHITSTPKPDWADTDMVGPISRALGVGVAFETDVGAAALAEHRWGVAKGCENFVYVTVGTGVGGGVMANGKLVHGLLHPEIGHMYVPHDRARDPFPGLCPFHGNCLEGLAAGPAVEARLGHSAREATADDPIWDLVAGYLAHMCINLTMTISPERIVLGGGLMQLDHLFPLIREHFSRLLNNYLKVSRLTEDLDEYIVAAGLGRRAGAYGALALAEQALSR